MLLPPLLLFLAHIMRMPHSGDPHYMSQEQQSPTDAPEAQKRAASTPAMTPAITA